MGLDLCYEKLILIFQIENIGLFFIFEIQKMVFYNLDLNPSDMDFISEPFLPQKPEELLRSGQFNTDVEVIIGTNSDEGLILLLG